MEIPMCLTEPGGTCATLRHWLKLLKQTAKDAGEQSKVEYSHASLKEQLERFLAFCNSDTESREQVLDELYNQPPIEMVESEVIMQCKWAASVIAANLDQLIRELSGDCDRAALQRELNLDTVERILLSWAFNARTVSNRLALFRRGSRIAHTCAAPNTRYASYQERGAHIAVRDIQQGELLTTSYFHPPWVALLSTPARREYLRQRHAFDCACLRCTSEEDDTRSLPCPNCQAGDVQPPPTDMGVAESALGGPAASGSGCLTYHAFTTTTRIVRVKRTDDDSDDEEEEEGSKGTAAPLTTTVTETSPIPYWGCKVCGCSLPNDESALLPATASPSGSMSDTADSAADSLAQLELAGGCSNGTALLLPESGPLESKCLRAVQHYEAQWQASGKVDAQAATQLLQTLERHVGKQHYTYNHMLLTHTAVLTSQVHLTVRDLAKDCGIGRGAPVEQYLQTLRDTMGVLVEGWTDLMGWLQSRTTTQQLSPTYPIHERMLQDALALLNIRDAMWTVAGAHPAAPEAAEKLEKLADQLLRWAAPDLDLLRTCKALPPCAQLLAEQAVTTRLHQRPPAPAATFPVTSTTLPHASKSSSEGRSSSLATTSMAAAGRGTDANVRGRRRSGTGPSSQVCGPPSPESSSQRSLELGSRVPEADGGLHGGLHPRQPAASPKGSGSSKVPAYGTSTPKGPMSGSSQGNGDDAAHHGGGGGKGGNSLPEGERRSRRDSQLSTRTPGREAVH